MKQINPSDKPLPPIITKILLGLSAFVTVSFISSYLMAIIPYGLFAVMVIISEAKDWLLETFPYTFSPFLAESDMNADINLAIWLNSLYFGLIAALLVSGNKKLILVGIGLGLAYMGGTCYIVYRLFELIAFS